MKEVKGGLKVSFGIETGTCLKALLLLRDSLIDSYIAKNGMLDPHDMQERCKEYKACVSMIHHFGNYAYDEHGLCVADYDKWPKDRLDAATKLEFALDGKTSDMIA